MLRTSLGNDTAVPLGDIALKMLVFLPSLKRDSFSRSPSYRSHTGFSGKPAHQLDEIVAGDEDHRLGGDELARGR